MADLLPEFEHTNDSGYTLQYSGVAGTLPIQLPPTPGNKIDEVLIRCPPTSNPLLKLQVSFDNGNTWLTLDSGEFVGWSPRSDASGNPIRQVTLQGTGIGVQYEVLINFGQQ